MSTNLYWEPENRKKNRAGKDDGLKWAIRKKYLFPKTLGAGDIPYLEGLTDAGTDATDLINAIEKYDEIRVWEAE